MLERGEYILYTGITKLYTVKKILPDSVSVFFSFLFIFNLYSWLARFLPYSGAGVQREKVGGGKG